MHSSSARFVTVLLTAMLGTLPVRPALASNLNFLADSPSAHFNDEDVRLLREAATKVLENKNSKATESWINPANGHSGRIDGRGAFKNEAGVSCRRLRLINKAEGLEGQATYTLCKDPEKGWMLSSPPPKPAT